MVMLKFDFICSEVRLGNLDLKREELALPSKESLVATHGALSNELLFHFLGHFKNEILGF